MQEEKTKNEQAKDNIVLSDVMRSASEIEERLRCALAGLENARECGDIETQKEYANDAGILFWVLGRSGSYDYKDGKVTLYD
jgi:hypothetical protein